MGNVASALDISEGLTHLPFQETFQQAEKVPVENREAFPQLLCREPPSRVEVRIKRIDETTHGWLFGNWYLLHWSARLFVP